MAQLFVKGQVTTQLSVRAEYVRLLRVQIYSSIPCQSRPFGIEDAPDDGIVRVDNLRLACVDNLRVPFFRNSGLLIRSYFLWEYC